MSASISRFFGACFLVAGTTIGAGMLAMPTTNAFSGFFPILFLLIFVWACMLSTAWIFLDVHLFAGVQTNLLTMSEKMLGKPAKILCWALYLLLLYSLTAAYIAGASSTLGFFLQSFLAISVKKEMIASVLVGLFSFFLYFGTRSCDWINRVFMSALVLCYIALLMGIFPEMDLQLLQHEDAQLMPIAIPVILTSFGFHIVIPTLSTYLSGDKVQLRRVIFLGSFLALIVYILWELVTLGSIPLQGKNSFQTAWIHAESITNIISSIIQSPWVKIAAFSFSFFAILTSFLGVSLSLSDFLSDGLSLKSATYRKICSLLLTFFPPLLFVLVYPKAFIAALEYAAIFVAILLGIYPTLMAFRLPSYQSLCKKAYLFVLLGVFSAIIVLAVLQENGYFAAMLTRYMQ